MPTISFKIPAEEARQLRQLARREKVTVSEYLRRRALMPAAASSKPRRVRCPLTGALIFSGNPGLPPLSTESVKDLLADFP